MEKKITLTIASRDFAINVDDEGFARILERDFGRFEGNRKFVDVKELLNAYVQRCYDTYADELQMKVLTNDIKKALKIRE